MALIGMPEVVLPAPLDSVEAPRRTRTTKAFQKICCCCLSNKQGGIMLQSQDLGLVLTVLQRVTNMEPVQLIGFSVVSPSATSNIGNIRPIIAPGELADAKGDHLVMGLREMFSPCIIENFIAEYCDRITSAGVDNQKGSPTESTTAFVDAIKGELELDLALGHLCIPAGAQSWAS
jgi:hypothetical protein